jgi:hypothetical protein
VESAGGAGMQTTCSRLDWQRGMCLWLPKLLLHPCQHSIHQRKAVLRLEEGQPSGSSSC